MTIINYTGHDIVVLDLASPVSYGESDKFKATPLSTKAGLVIITTLVSVGLARVQKKVADMATIDGLLTEGAVFGDISLTVGEESCAFPPHQEGVFILVSQMVVAAAAAAGRRTDDLLTPGTTVRDIANPGNVLGTKKLQRN
jgi:hypothetical protein